MKKSSVFFMKLLRRIINPLSKWYRTTAFLCGLKSYENNIDVKGSVYLWNDNVSIGSGTGIYPGVTLWGKGEIDIGKNTEIGINTVIYSKRRVSIGNNVLIAANCYIIDSNHSIYKNDIIREQEDVFKGPVIIEDDAWLGAGVKVLSGVHIGKGAVIGAQSLVNKDIPDYAIAVGVPAKVISFRKEK